MKLNKKLFSVGLATLLLVGCASEEEEVNEAIHEETIDGVGEDGKVYGISERIESRESVPLFIGEELVLGDEKIKLSEAEVLDNLEDTPLHLKSMTELNREESNEDNRKFLKVDVEYSVGEGVEDSQVINSLLNLQGEDIEESEEEEDNKVEQITTKPLVGVGVSDLDGEVEAKEEDILIKQGTDFKGYLVFDLGEGEVSGNNLYAQLNTLTYGEVIEFPITDDKGNIVKRDVEQHGEVLKK